MKIIVNRGFDKTFTRIVVVRDKQTILDCPIERDCCEFEAKEGECFLVKLLSFCTFMLPIATIDCNGVDDIFYISPTRLFQKWTILNYMILPGLLLLFFVLQKTRQTNLYNWECTGIIVFWALSLICMGCCQYIPFFRKRMFKINKI